VRASAKAIEGNLLSGSFQDVESSDGGPLQDYSGGSSFGVMSNLFEPR
jgi:hypothetical protein